MGSKKSVSLEVLKSVFNFLNKNFKGIELYEQKINGIKVSYIRVLELNTNKSKTLSKKEIASCYDLIEKDRKDDAILFILENRSFLKKQKVNSTDAKSTKKQKTKKTEEKKTKKQKNNTNDINKTVVEEEADLNTKKVFESLVNLFSEIELKKNNIVLNCPYTKNNIVLSQKYIDEAYNSIQHYGHITDKVILSMIIKYKNLYYLLKDKYYQKIFEDLLSKVLNSFCFDLNVFYVLLSYQNEQLEGDILNSLLSYESEQPKKEKKQLINCFLFEELRVFLKEYNMMFFLGKNECGDAFEILVLKKEDEKDEYNSFTLPLDKNLYKKIRCINNKGIAFVSVFNEIKNKYSEELHDIDEIFITPECFSCTKDTFAYIDRLHEKIKSWNDLYEIEIFKIEDYSIWCKDKILTKNNFLSIYNESDDYDFVQKVSQIEPSTFFDLKYIGSENLDSFFEKEYPKDEKFINERLFLINNIPDIDLSFIKRKPEWFNGDYYNEIDKLIEYKEVYNNEIATVNKFYNKIQVKKGFFVIDYSEVDGKLVKTSNINDDIDNVLNKIKSISDSQCITLYRLIYKKIRTYIKDMNKYIMNKLCSKYDYLDIEFIDDIKLHIKIHLLKTVRTKLFIKNETELFCGDLNLSSLKEDVVFDILYKDLDKLKLIMLAIVEKRICNKLEKDNSKREIIYNSINTIIVSLVYNIKCLRLSSCSDILNGTAKLSNGYVLNYYGLLKDYGILFIQKRIEYLLLERILIIDSNEDGLIIKINSCLEYIIKNLPPIDDKFSIKEDMLYVTLTEYITKTNFFKEQKSHLILKSVSVNDIVNFSNSISENTVISETVIDNIPNIMQNCDVFDDNTVYFIRLQINLVDSESVKSFLENILYYNKVRQEVK